MADKGARTLNIVGFAPINPLDPVAPKQQKPIDPATERKRIQKQKEVEHSLDLSGFIEGTGAYATERRRREQGLEPRRAPHTSPRYIRGGGRDPGQDTRALQTLLVSNPQDTLLRMLLAASQER